MKRAMPPWMSVHELRPVTMLTRGGSRQTFERTAIDLVSRCLWLEEAITSASGVVGLRGVAGLGEAGLSGVLMPGERGIARPVSAGVTNGTLTDADLAAWLAQPERPGVRVDVQFGWAIRAILTDLAMRSPASAVTPDLLKGVYERLGRVCKISF